MKAQLVETVTLSDYHDIGEKYPVGVDVKLFYDGCFEEGFRIFEGEPEDMSLGRDLSGAHDVFNLALRAYELGKLGVEMEFTRKTEEDE